MPTPTTYTYPISSLPNSTSVDPGRLEYEIAQSSIVTQLDPNGSIIVKNGDVLIKFKDVLPAADKLALDGNTAAAEEIPPVGGILAQDNLADLLDDLPILVEEVTLKKEPQEPDGRRVVVSSPAREGFNTFFTGAGDDMSNPPFYGRGEGPEIAISFSYGEVGTRATEFQYAEPIELHDGEVHWDTEAFGFGDHFTLKARIPGTAVTPNGTTTGNCNLVDYYGLGNVIVPAPGNGTHDVDLATARPVPAGRTDNGDYTGYWDVEYGTGAVSASLSPGEAQFNLLDFEVAPNLIKRVFMGNPLGVFEVDVYKTEYVHPTWIVNFSVTRNTERNEGSCGGWLMMFRKVIT